MKSGICLGSVRQMDATAAATATCWKERRKWAGSLLYDGLNSQTQIHGVAFGREDE